MERLAAEKSQIKNKFKQLEFDLIPVNYCAAFPDIADFQSYDSQTGDILLGKESTI